MEKTKNDVKTLHSIFLSVAALQVIFNELFVCFKFFLLEVNFFCEK